MVEGQSCENINILYSSLFILFILGITFYIWLVCVWLQHDKLWSHSGLTLLLAWTCASRLFTAATSSLIYSPLHYNCVSTPQCAPQAMHITAVSQGRSRHLQHPGHCFQEDAIAVKSASHEPHWLHGGYRPQRWWDAVRGRSTEGEEDQIYSSKQQGRHTKLTQYIYFVFVFRNFYWNV